LATAQGSGSQSWISVGGTLVQPTEAGEVSLIIIFLAWYLSTFRDSMHKLPYLLMALFLLFAPLILVYIQPDFGMTITYAFLGGALILVAGVRLSPPGDPGLGDGVASAAAAGRHRCKATCWRASASSMPTDDATGQISAPILGFLRAGVSTACPASA
jgi:hypothetical protein